MEPHKPYLPGMGRAMKVGPVLSLLSVVAASKYRDDRYPEWLRSHSKTLYDQSVRRLDRTLTPWLESHDDATVVLTADHGEEFDHGVVSHRQLYDETVKIPLVANAEVGHLMDGYTRQLDLAPTLTDYLNIDAPKNWTGDPAGERMPLQRLLCGPDEMLEKIWAGVRTESAKLIYTFDYDWTVLDTEYYRVQTDPDELRPYRRRDAPDRLVDELTTFTESPAIREPLQEWHPEVGLADSTNIQTRLEDLGYLQ